MLFTKSRLSFNDVTILKGFAILAIVLHNFCHKQPGMVTENQHFFSGDNFNHMLTVVSHGAPHLLVNLFSHYGHYGVAIFVFIAGYGLASKYNDSLPRVSFAQFMRKHIGKLWLLMLPLLLPHVVFMCIKSPVYFDKHWLDFILLVTFSSGWNPAPYTFHGPWWFFSLIMPFYVIFYFLAYRKSLKGIVVLTVLCFAAQITATAMGADGAVAYMSRNFIGWMLPFTAGLVFARRGIFPRYGVAAAALALFFILGCNRFTWLLTFPLLPVACMAMTKMSPSSGKLYTAMLFVGRTSAYLFASHPIVRGLVMGVESYNLYLAIAVYAAACIALAVGYRYLIYYSAMGIARAVTAAKKRA